MTIKIDTETLKKIVSENHPTRAVFNAPDGLLLATRNIARELEKEHSNLQTIIISDPTYGSCDTVDSDAQRLGADIAFHIAHNVKVKKFGKLTYGIDALDDVSFEEVAHLSANEMKSKNVKAVGLVAFAQHIQELERVARIMEENGIKAVIGKGMGQLHDGQIFGCEFYPAFNIRDQVDAMLMLGQSMFHGIGLALSTGKPSFMLDPYSNEIIDISKTAEERLKKAILSVYRARDATRFGVIIGLKEGQMMPDQSIMIKQKLETLGKQVNLIALREITAERLDSMTDIEAFVQTGCPRISIDGYNFKKPVLSVPQTDALINLLSGKEISADLFERKHWL